MLVLVCVCVCVFASFWGVSGQKACRNILVGFGWGLFWWVVSFLLAAYLRDGWWRGLSASSKPTRTAPPQREGTHLGAFVLYGWYYQA